MSSGATATKAAAAVTGDERRSAASAARHQQTQQTTPALGRADAGKAAIDDGSVDPERRQTVSNTTDGTAQAFSPFSGSREAASAVDRTVVWGRISTSGRERR